MSTVRETTTKPATGDNEQGGGEETPQLKIKRENIPA